MVQKISGIKSYCRPTFPVEVRRVELAVVNLELYVKHAEQPQSCSILSALITTSSLN
jgi:hypothetical protein